MSDAYSDSFEASSTTSSIAPDLEETAQEKKKKTTGLEDVPPAKPSLDPAAMNEEASSHPDVPFSSGSIEVEGSPFHTDASSSKKEVTTIGSHSDVHTTPSDSSTPYNRPRRAAVVLNGDEEEGSMSEQQLEHYTAFKNITSSSSKKTSGTPSASLNHSIGKSSGTTSTDTLDVDAFGPSMRERRLHALEASGNAPFRQLKSYVAFAEDVSADRSSSADGGGDQQRQSSSSVLLSVQQQQQSVKRDGASVVSHVSSSSSPLVVQKSLSAPPSAKALQSSDATESTFSSLSAAPPPMHQSLSHFTPSVIDPKEKGQEAAAVSAAAIVVPSSSSSPPPPPPLQASPSPTAALDSPGSPPVAVSTPVGFSRSPPTGGMTFTMPPLPPPAALLTTPAAVTEAGNTNSKAASPSPASPFRASPTTSAFLPLTLAEKEEKEKEAAHGRRMEEMRETSLAVERLVAAFASLRGHGPPPSSSSAATAPSSPPPHFHKVEREGRDSSTSHRVGAASSVLASTTVRPTMDRFQRKLERERKVVEGNADWEAASAANTQILEESLQQCVLALMAERAGGDGKQKTTSSSPHVVSKSVTPGGRYHLSISADEFQYGYSSSAAPRKASRRSRLSQHHLSVFDGEMSAFSPDAFFTDEDHRDADAILQRGIEDALRKYVWQRVAWPTSESIKRLAEPLSSDVVYVMLLDVIGICQAILEHGFSSQCGSSSSVDAPVLVQYVGPASLKSLARTILHCLPFEALTHQQNDKTIFRLEYWVSRERVLSVANAVNTSLREHLIRYASAYRFSPFREEDLLGGCSTADDDSERSAALGPPPASPVFALLPLASLTRQTREAATTAKGPTLVRKASTSSQEVLGVGVDALEGLAFSVSKLCSSILEAESRRTTLLQNRKQANSTSLPDLGKFGTPEDFQSLCSVVAVTVEELLNDEDILSAVKRRALTKWKEQLATRGASHGSITRQEQERIIVQRAEAEAAQLVSRVMQEMKAQSIIATQR